MKQVLFVAAALLTFASCKVNYDKAPSGLLYKIIPGKDTGALLKAGQFIKLNITFTIRLPESDKDSVLNSSVGKLPGYSPVDTSVRSRYTLTEVLTKCRVGDSVICLMSVDTLKNSGQIPEYTKAFARGSSIRCTARILQSFNSQKDLMADYQNSIKKITAQETKELQAYVDKKGIKTTTTEKGVLVHVENAGDPTNMADSGKQITIMYKGYLETTGVVFDTNLDSSKGHTKPIDITLGRRAVIPGWEDGLKLFGKGGKGTMFIPAMLAYGPQGKPPVIPQYANLIFDVTINDVKIAPPPPIMHNAMGNPLGGMTPAQVKEMEARAMRQRDSLAKKK